MKAAPVEIQFDAQGLVPVVVEDVAGGVLLLAYADAEAVEATRVSGEAHFHSRSRKALWRKGETSGNVLRVREIRIDCDGDALLYLVEPAGPACHTNARSCFYRRLDGTAPEVVGVEMLGELEATLRDRKRNPPAANSYTARLFAAPAAATHGKIGEEAFEVVLASERGDLENLAWEIADLWFHTTVLLVRHGVPVARVFAELARRRAVPK